MFGKIIVIYNLLASNYHIALPKILSYIKYPIYKLYNTRGYFVRYMAKISLILPELRFLSHVLYPDLLTTGVLSKGSTLGSAIWYKRNKHNF